MMRKRRKLDTDHLDYLKKKQKPVNRRRTDPLVELSSIMESILNEMRAQPGVQPFLFSVSPKCVPDYYKIVAKPMDLQTMRENLREKKYQTREDFLSDVNQILENSTLYNGESRERLWRICKFLGTRIMRGSCRCEKSTDSSCQEYAWSMR